MTIRGSDVINLTSQMRKLRFIEVSSVIELENGRGGILTQGLLTLKPVFSTTMFSSSHDH